MFNTTLKKNFLKDLRTYRKDTFITSFFATLTILLIVLIICCIPSNAQEVNGGDVNNNTDYSYDIDDYRSLGYFFPKLDISKTDPPGALYMLANPVLEQNSFDGGLYADSYNLCNAYAQFDSTSVSADNVLNGQTQFNIPEFLTFNGNSYDLKDYNYFLLTANGSGYTLSLFKVNVVNLTWDSGALFWINDDDSILLIYDGSLSNAPIVSLPTSRRINGAGVDDDVYLITENSTKSLLYSNCSVMGDLYTYPDTWTREVTYFGAEYNYLVGQAGNGGGSSGSSETDENNMYLKSCDFKFNIHKYGDINNNDSTADNYDFAMANMTYKNYWGNKSGLIDFECVPTDYQIEHAEDFYLYFQFNVIQRFDALPAGWNSVPNPILNGFKSHSVNTTTTETFYSKTYFNDLIDNSNRITWRIDELFNDLKVTAYNTPYIKSDLSNNSFSSVVAQERELGGIVWKNDNNLGYVIMCYAFLGCDNYTITDAGSYSETYGFCSQVAKNTDSSLTDNTNPYIPDDETDSDGKPDNSQSIVSDGNISLINNNYDNDNNNQTVNFNSDDAELVDTLTDKFIPSNMDNTGGLTSQFEDLANTNGYITFFKNTFSFVPVGVWNTLLVLLGTTCSIIAVAFVIKVLRGM